MDTPDTVVPPPPFRLLEFNRKPPAPRLSAWARDVAAKWESLLHARPDLATHYEPVLDELVSEWVDGDIGL